MYVYIYMYVCKYVYMYIYILIYVYVNMYIYMYMYMYLLFGSRYFFTAGPRGQGIRIIFGSGDMAKITQLYFLNLIWGGDFVITNMPCI